MLTDCQRALVTATVPALREHGEAVTRRFYADLFAAHPDLWNLFNPANQRDGGQARSLAASVLAYAEHIDHPERLSRMVERISGKHGSLEVKAEHYPIVGYHLLGAIKQVLGDAATPDILDAWGAAYGQLAAIMTGTERALYDKGAAQTGGWRGFKPFRVARKVKESEVISSFYLRPVDGTPLPLFKPGQYVSVQVRPEGFAYEQIRQYSLSCAPNAAEWRISVRREDAPLGVLDAPGGLVSGHLHHALQAGGVLHVHMPLGDFVLNDGDTPVVLLSGGAGITAVLSMLEHLAGPDGGTREAVFLHAARSRGHHAFGSHLRALAQARPGLRVAVAYEEAGPGDGLGTHHDAVGRITADLIRQHLPERDARFYYCGPLGFMAAMEAALDQLGVPLARRFSEAFAPDPSFTAADEVPAPQVRR